MEDNFNEISPEQPHTRPIRLTVLCILTFISTGISALGCLFIPAFSDLMEMIIKQNQGMDAQATADTLTVLHAGWGYYMVVLLFTLLSLTGALLMWNLKKNGFHFYAIANIVLFYLPVVWLGLPFSIVAAFFPAIFIGLYALHLKIMN